MTFQEGGSFGGGRIETSGGGGGGGGRGVAIGGGGLIGVIVIFLISQLTGVDLSGLVGGGGGAASPGPADGTLGTCTAAQANTDRSCRLAGTIDLLDTFWADELKQSGDRFAKPGVRSFSQAVATGCGNASSETGPFYCPPDQKIYIDLTFYDLLTSRFGASGGSLAEIYVVAHEYGHHIQQLTGVMDSAQRGGTGETSDSVRVELMADCYAGMAIGHGATTVDPDTDTTYLKPVTEKELSDALSAAAAVGDDHIQKSSGGGVNPDTWTHGSSAERQRWFTTGYTKGTMAACDTFAAKTL